MPKGGGGRFPKIVVNGMQVPVPGSEPGWADGNYDQSDPTQDPGQEPQYDAETMQAVEQLQQQMQPWRQPQPSGGGLSTVGGEAKPDWWDQPPDQYLAENPPIDFHNDPNALVAITPEHPPLHWWQDKSHPDHLSRMGSLLRLLGYGAMGAAAGAGSRTAGEGFTRGQQAAANLQQLQQQRQQEKDLSAWRQAQTQHLQAQTAGIPQQQATLQDYRRARTQFLGAQAQKVQADADKARRGPNDKLLRSYQGADGRMHFLFQKGNSTQTYDSAGVPFYEKPEKQAQQKPLIGHGPDGSLYLIDPTTGHSRPVTYTDATGRTKTLMHPQAVKGAKPRIASAAAFGHLEDWKAREWAKIHNDSSLDEETKLNRLEDLQNHYERVVQTLGGSVIPYDVRSGTRAPAPELNAPKGQNFWSQVPGAVQRHH